MTDEKEINEELKLIFSFLTHFEINNVYLISHLKNNEVYKYNFEII